MANASVSFDTTLSAFGKNTGIVVPPELVDKLGAGKRPPVSVDVNGFMYRNTVGVMGGQYLVSVSAAVRRETGLTAGDEISVTLTLDESPREFDMHEDLAAALAAEPVAQAFFLGLSNSLQRYHVGQVTDAKTDATRERRIDKAIKLFLAGKKR